MWAQVGADSAREHSHKRSVQSADQRGRVHQACLSATLPARQVFGGNCSRIFAKKIAFVGTRVVGCSPYRSTVGVGAETRLHCCCSMSHCLLSKRWSHVDRNPRASAQTLSRRQTCSRWRRSCRGTHRSADPVGERSGGCECSCRARCWRPRADPRIGTTTTRATEVNLGRKRRGSQEDPVLGHARASFLAHLAHHVHRHA